MKAKTAFPVRIRLPGLKQNLGLGEVVKKMTTAVGVRPCSACERRADVLNQRVVFTPTRGGNR